MTSGLLVEPALLIPVLLAAAVPWELAVLASPPLLILTILTSPPFLVLTAWPVSAVLPEPSALVLSAVLVLRCPLAILSSRTSVSLLAPAIGL